MSEKPCLTGTSRLPVVEILIRACSATWSKTPYTLRRVCGKPGRSVASRALAPWQSPPPALDSKAGGGHLPQRLKRARGPGRVRGAQRVEAFRAPPCRRQGEHSDDGSRRADLPGQHSLQEVLERHPLRLHVGFLVLAVVQVTVRSLDAACQIDPARLVR